MNKVLLAIIGMVLLVLFSSTVAADPPFTQVSTGDEGYEIKFPIIDYVKEGDDLKLHFHVFNTSNGVPILNESTECFFHLYSPTGGHVYKDENIQDIHDTFDFEVPIDSNNFSTTGTYSYLFQCNNSNAGGFVSHNLQVTTSGESEEAFNGSTSISLVGLGILLLFLFLGYIFWQEDSFMFYLCYGFWYLALLVPMYTLRVLSNLPGISTTIVNLLDSLYTIYIWFYYVMIIILGLQLLLTVLQYVAFWKNTPAWKRKKFKEDNY